MRARPVPLSGATSPPLAGKQVIVESQDRILDGFFAVDKALVRYELRDGTLSEPHERLVFERGDSCAVIPYDPLTREVLLVCQFRYPAYTRDPCHAWLWEALAGAQEEGELPEAVVRREAMEEAGVALSRLVYVVTVYPSPGGTSERMHLYVAPMSSASRRGPGGGVDPGEDIEVAMWRLDDALDACEGSDCHGRQIVDAKTVLLLYYLDRHWGELS